MEILGASLLLVLILMGATIYGSLSWGFVLYKFWYWFILPVFVTLPLITFWQAVGIFFVIGLFNVPIPNETKDEYLDKTKSYGNILIPWVTLLMGWFMHLFM